MNNSSKTTTNELKEQEDSEDADVNECREFTKAKSTLATPQIPVTLTLMQTAYKFYTMKAMSCDIKNPLDFLLNTTAKATYQEPLQAIYGFLQNKSMNDVILPYTIKKLCIKLGEFDKAHETELRKKWRKKKGDDTNKEELCRRMIIIYYNIVFDDSFRNVAYVMFHQEEVDKHIISLNVGGIGARITNGIMMYKGNTCIECNGALEIRYKSGTRDNVKGSTAIAYHKTSAPKLCTSYQKRCKNCDIYYNHNKIDYTDKSKNKARRNATLYLDPDEFSYYSIAGKSTRNFIHQSIHRSIRNHQYCNKSTSINIWLQHFNDDFRAYYDKLSKTKDLNRLLPSIELGYTYILRYFYFYSLLCRIRDIENFGSININGHSIKIALIVTGDDKKEMEQELKIFDKIKNDRASDDENKDDETKDNGDIAGSKIRAQQQYFKFYVKRYYEQLIATSVDELKEVPVRINEAGEFEIYPGWFIVYGDGGEKITRLRCAYPAILAKLDYIIETMKNDANQEININDIEKDDDIDLVINDDARKYTAQRYYECEESPYFNDPENNKKTYKCCKEHIAKIVHHFKELKSGMKLSNVTDFIKWYQIHAALAKMKNTDVRKTIKATYTIDEDALTSIKKKQEKKMKELELAANNFMVKNPEKHEQYEKFVDNIYNKINSYRNRPSLDRKCKSKAKANANANAVSDKKQALYDKLRNILGDYDFDTDDVEEMIDANQTSVIELLNLEFNYNKYLDEFGGCRKSKNITGATTARTKGLNVLMNCAGMIINVREEIVRETPTTVLLDIAKTCTNNETTIQYANRIEAIGYDMICRMYHHLKTLVKAQRLSAIQEAFWLDLIWRAFIDIWHIFTHTDELCTENGTFHPKLAKFDKILYNINILMERINDVIAEQFWSTMNATSQMKAMCRETFTLFLIEKRAYHNKARYNEIKNEGWTFIPIKYFTTLRDIKKDARYKASLPTKSELKAKNNEPLSRVEIKSHLQSEVRKLIKANPIKYTPKNNKKRKKILNTTPVSSRPKRRKVSHNDDNNDNNDPSK